LLELVCCFSTTSFAQSSDVDGHSMLAENAADIVNINTAELQTRIENDKNMVLIDVRAPNEIATLGGTIDAGSRNINLIRGWLEFRIAEEVPDKSTPIVVYCSSYIANHGL